MTIGEVQGDSIQSVAQQFLSSEAKNYLKSRLLALTVKNVLQYVHIINIYKIYICCRFYFFDNLLLQNLIRKWILQMNWHTLVWLRLSCNLARLNSMGKDWETRRKEEILRGIIPANPEGILLGALKEQMITMNFLSQPNKMLFVNLKKKIEKFWFDLDQILGINEWKWEKKWKPEAQVRIFPRYPFLPVAMTKPFFGKNPIFLGLMGQFLSSASGDSSIPPGILCSKFQSQQCRKSWNYTGSTKDEFKEFQKLCSYLLRWEVHPTGRKTWISCVSFASCGNLWLEFRVPAL